MRFAIPMVLMLGVLALLGFGLTHDPREVPSPLIGKQAPAFALPGLNDTPPQLSNADLKGRPVLVIFLPAGARAAGWSIRC